MRGKSKFPRMEKTSAHRRHSIVCGHGDLNGVVVSGADCCPKGAGFNSWVMLGIFPLRNERVEDIGLEILKLQGCCASICFFFFFILYILPIFTFWGSLESDWNDECFWQEPKFTICIHTGDKLKTRRIIYFSACFVYRSLITKIQKGVFSNRGCKI
jgi:hypothetical protein